MKQSVNKNQKVASFLSQIQKLPKFLLQNKKLYKQTRMAKLSVNINKIASLRNTRNKNQPSLIEYTKKILNYGAKSITIHPRPDERHIKYTDLKPLSQVLKKKKIEWNIEGYPNSTFIKLIKKYQPLQCTLVPDKKNVLTSNKGWPISQKKKFLKKTIQKLKSKNLQISLFIDPLRIKKNDLIALKELDCNRVEFFTQAYANAYINKDKKASHNILKTYSHTAKQIQKLGLKINAGHDLNQKNLKKLLKAVPEITEVSIGHALISEALLDGLKNTVKRYLEICKNSKQTNKKTKNKEGFC